MEKLKIKIYTKGFTLVELLVVVAILSFILTGMIGLFIQTSTHGNMSTNKTIALNEAQGILEAVRNHDFDSIVTDYSFGGSPGDTFALTNPTGMGKIYINSADPDLLTLQVVVSWQDKYNRIIGEDTDLDGVLDGGEDINGNTQLDSPVSLMSMITRR